MLRPDPSFPTQINVKGHRWSVTQRGYIGGLKCSESNELDGAVVGTSFKGAEVVVGVGRGVLGCSAGRMLLSVLGKE
jgi:hypothetical protein